MPHGYGIYTMIYYHYAAERGIRSRCCQLLERAFLTISHANAAWTQESESRWVSAALAVIIAVMLTGYEEVNLGDITKRWAVSAAVACGYVALGETAADRERNF